MTNKATLSITLIFAGSHSRVADLLADCENVDLSIRSVADLILKDVHPLAAKDNRHSLMIFEGEEASVDYLEKLEHTDHLFDLIVSLDNGGRLARYAVKNNVSDYLSWPLSQNALLETLRSISVQKSVKRADGTQSHIKTSVVMGCKGGIGSSFIAYQAGHLMAKQERSSTVLMDFDLQYPSISTYCDAYPEHSVLHALTSAQHLDAVGLAGYVHRLESGLGLLAPVKSDLPLADDFPAANVEKLIGTAKTICDHLIIDLPPTLTLFALSALQQSDHIYLVVDQSIPALSQAVKQLTLFREELHLPSSKISVVVNQFRSDNIIALSDVQETLHIQSLFQLPPSEKLCARVIEEAKPLAELAPKHALTKGFIPLVQDMCDVKPTEGSLLRRLSNVFKKTSAEASL